MPNKNARQLLDSFRKFHQCSEQYILPELRKLKRDLKAEGYCCKLNLERGFPKRLIKTVSLSFIPKLKEQVTCTILIYGLYLGDTKGRVVFETNLGVGGKTEIMTERYAVEEIDRRLVNRVLGSYFKEIEEQ